MADEDQAKRRLRRLLRDPGSSIPPRASADTLIREAARRQRLRPARAATVVIAVLAAAIAVPLILLPGSSATGGLHQRPARGLAESAYKRATIAINPQIGQTFTLASASAAPKLTAQQAWTRFARLNRWSRTAIPSSVHVQLGFYTLPAGPNGPGGTETYINHNELAYGYSSPPDL